MDDKKVSIERFIKNKELEKIDKMIGKKLSVDDAQDKLEKIFKDSNIIPLDAGTNRYIFKSSKNKNIVLKIACDNHGIEANYREFYLSDKDKRLTKSYSISPTGAVLVAERVERIKTKETMDAWKKEVKKMLFKLSKKILLVDCKLSNFKNFGLRKIKNGYEPVLLDYGDTVPFDEIQNFNESVNFDEESNVSIRCRNIVGTISNRHRCKGTLIPNDDFSALVCDKCGMVCSFNDCYKEFILDKIKKRKKSDRNFINGIDEDKLKIIEDEYNNEKDKFKSDGINIAKKYAIYKMKEVSDDIMKNNNLSELPLIDGYRIPKPDESIFMGKIKYSAVIMHKLSPVDYLKFIGENPNKWSDNDNEDKTEDDNEDDAQYYPTYSNLNDEDDNEDKTEDENDNEDKTEDENDNEDKPKDKDDANNHVDLTGICDVDERYEMLDDNKFMDMVSTTGKILDFKNINLLHLISPSLENDVIVYKKAVKLNPMISIKLYNILIALTDIHNHHAIKDYTAEDLLISVGVSFQDAVWSAIYKAYKISVIDRNYMLNVFQTEWTKAMKIICSYIKQSDITIDDLANISIIYNLVKLSKDELSQLYTYAMGNDDINIQIEHTIDKYGIENIFKVMQIDKYRDKMKQLYQTENINKLITKDNLIPISLTDIKDKPLLIAWKEDGETTAVNADLYALIKSNAANIIKGKVHEINTISIKQWCNNK